MKYRNVLILAALLTLLAAFGCKKQETEVTDTSATVAATTDSTATDTGATPTDTSSTTSGSVSNLSDSDKDFMMKAAIGGIDEVMLGQMASGKATKPDVKAFADRMVTDHSKANDELKQLATTKGVTLPTDIDADHKAANDKVMANNGAAFDKAYMDDMVEDHKKDVAEFEKASKEAQDPDLKAWAAKTLPTLQDHLKMAQDTQKKLK
jgi:putative membrane protein